MGSVFGFDVAVQDYVFEGLLVLLVGGAGLVGIFLARDWIGGQVGFSRRHLMYFPGCESVQPHEGVRDQCRRVRVVKGGGDSKVQSCRSCTFNIDCSLE